MHKALLNLKVREVDEDRRELRGVATTGRLDRVGDIIEPLGVRFAKSVPLLVAHDHNRPVGTVKFGQPTKDGVPFTAKMPKISEPGPLKDRVDTAFGEVKHGLIDRVSIGFHPIGDKVEPLPGGGLRFLEVSILELSLVAVPANEDARILEVRAAKTARAAKRSGVVKLGPGKPSSRVVYNYDRENLINARARSIYKKATGQTIPVFFTDEARQNWRARKKAEANAKGAIWLDPFQCAEGELLTGHFKPKSRGVKVKV